ncbi:MAG: class I SAM-dependent methyltransferase [Chloroflexi bacterium]|nr:MAG: class I SAM-dependent methyltransferase [Chloroflexota bacterium]
MHNDRLDDPRPAADAAEGVHEAVLALLESEPPGRLLDAPAGEGAFALHARERGYTVVCGDIAPARFRASDMTCLKLDLNQPWDLESESFDYVVSIEAVEHLENPWHLVREANRVLKTQGTLILTTPNILSIRSRLSYLLRGYPIYFTYMVQQDSRSKEERPIDHINPIGFLELRHILARCGFIVQQGAANRLQKRVVSSLLKRLISSRGLSQVRDDQAKSAVRETLLSDPLLFGEILIVKAKKITDV